jgi:hypothetical protein
MTAMLLGVLLVGCSADPAPETTPTATPIRSLTPTTPSRPVNDDPPGIDVTSLPFTHSTDTTLGQIHAMEPSPNRFLGGGQSVWYAYTPSENLTLVADTTGSDYDTVIDVMQGTLSDDVNLPFEQLQEVVCNDNAADALQSEVVFAATAGQPYLIRVMSAGEALGGKLTFHLFPQ